MKPIDEKELKLIAEIQEHNNALIEKEKRINAKVKQIIKEEYEDELIR